VLVGGAIDGSESTRREHELVWHRVRKEKPLMCMQCGQVFQLEMEEEHHGDGDGHDHHLENTEFDKSLYGPVYGRYMDHKHGWAP